jgi:hypothetical protein
VTKIGTLAGTLELRRAVAEAVEFCIVNSPCREGVVAKVCFEPSDVEPTLTLSRFAGATQESRSGMFERALPPGPLVTGLCGATGGPEMGHGRVIPTL